VLSSPRRPPPTGRHPESWRSFFGVLRASQTTCRAWRPVRCWPTARRCTAPRPQAALACRRWSTTRRARRSGRCSRSAQRREAAIRIGAVGLGTGSVAAYVRPDDHLTFFEIDPLVVRISTDPKHFSYTTQCAKGRVDYVIGDARLTVAKQAPETFDVLLIDAFSSDAVPAHLLTVQAVEGYLTKLKPDGVLILHLSNRNLDLMSPAQAVARAAGGWVLTQSYRPAANDPKGRWESAEDAVIIAKNHAALAPFVASRKWQTGNPFLARPWTDDYTNLAGALYANLRQHWELGL
jgi:SAM-dependent methyltransferase